MALYLTEQDVRGLVGMSEATEAVEACFRSQGMGRATHEPRRRVRTERGALHVMSAADADAGVFGLKSYTTTSAGARFHLLLYSAADGKLLAIMEADRLGQLRTGAASGVATRLLAREDSAVAALFGTGYQAETQLESLAHVPGILEIRVYSRTEEKRREFARRMGERVRLSVRAVESPEAALDGADVITTMTASTRPVFDGALVRDGMHLNVTGSNSLLKREVDDATIARADLICVDSLAAVPLEGGDLLGPLEKGLIRRESLVEIGLVACGRHVGRTEARQVTLFKSHGIALEDIALAAIVYRRGVERGFGHRLPE